MNILNVFDLQIPISIEKEINNSILTSDTNIDCLKNDYKYIERFENQISPNLDKETVIEKIKNFEDLSLIEKRYNIINNFIDSFKHYHEVSDKINTLSEIVYIFLR